MARKKWKFIRKGGWRWKAEQMRQEAQRAMESGDPARAKEFLEAATGADEIAERVAKCFKGKS